MADDSPWNPFPEGWTPTPEPTPKRRVVLFEFTYSEHLYQCELLDHAEGGVVAQYTRNGEFLEGQLFETLRLAVLWAHERRKAIDKSGA